MGRERSQLRECVRSQVLNEEKENPKMPVFASGSKMMKKRKEVIGGRRMRWR
jgi:hypothetical protein